MKKLAAVLVLALAASFALVACGSDDDDGDTAATTQAPATTQTTTGGGGGGGGGGGIVQLEADPSGQLAYDTETLTADSGNITIDLDNPAPIAHDVAVEDDSGKELGKSEIVTGESTSVTLQNMQPGEYTFYCTVPGHRQAGMEGTLTVR